MNFLGFNCHVASGMTRSCIWCGHQSLARLGQRTGSFIYKYRCRRCNRVFRGARLLGYRVSWGR